MLNRVITVFIFLMMISFCFAIKPVYDMFIVNQTEKEAEDGTIIVVSQLQGFPATETNSYYDSLFKSKNGWISRAGATQVNRFWPTFEIKLKDSNRVLCYMKIQDFETAVGNETAALTFKVHKKYENGTLYDIFCGPLPYDDYKYPKLLLALQGTIDNKHYYGYGFDDTVQHMFLWLDNKNAKYDDLFTNTPMIMNYLVGLFPKGSSFFFEERHKDDIKTFYEHVKEPYRYIIDLEVTKCEALLEDGRWFLLSDNIMEALELLVENDDSEGLELKKRVDTLLEYYNEYFTNYFRKSFIDRTILRIDNRNFIPKYDKPITTIEEINEYKLWLTSSEVKYDVPITTQEELNAYLEWLKLNYSPDTFNSFYFIDEVQARTRVNPIHLDIKLVDNGPLVDLYGTEFKFELTDTGYKVTSAGYDKKFGTNDDVSRSFKGVK